MTRRLLLGYLSVTAVVLLLLEVPLAVFYRQREIDRLTAEVERDATVIATIYEDALESGSRLDPRPALDYQSRTGARVVVTDHDGISRVDTEQPIPRDLSTRPEVASALQGRRAGGTRSSATLGHGLLYVALPVASGGVVHGAVRVSLDMSAVNRDIRRFWLALAAVAGIVLAAMALIGWAIATSVTRPLRQLRTAATHFAEGDLDTPIGPTASGPPELHQLADAMATMARRLDGLIDEQRAFVADASHQLRSPLTALRLRLENLQAHLGGSDGAELDAAIDETSRLARLVADLLLLARADRPRPSVPVDLSAVVTERVDTWAAAAEHQGVTLRTQGADHPAFASALPGAVEQILDNALDNALAASPAGGEVLVAIHREAGHQRLIVSDHGPGLTDADKHKALRRFWRGDTATPGTGLGLPIAAALATASGGSLRLADRRPRGLELIVQLPAMHPPRRPAARAPGPDTSETANISR